jgi:hypothetical protein
MRLLKRFVHPETGLSSLVLEEHVGESIPSYAILSHCWGSTNEEVSYIELTTGSPAMTAKSGYRKIWQCLLKAEEDGLQYLWADTCCIDKSSSAELSEGINSMFKWYEKATVCYAFLEDVMDAFEDPEAPNSAFRRSRWFTRGWTLQELIAPSTVVFIAKDWQEIGTKNSVARVVSEITNIDVRVLLNGHYGEISVAHRMSWAANRQTTRIEDRAYSLLGLFGINMPTIYGEGGRAFTRLQHEILKNSNDHTLFAWDTQPWEDGYRRLPSMLAPSPENFKNSMNFSPKSTFQFCQDFGIRTFNPFQQMTNVGFQISLPLLQIGSFETLAHLLEGRKFRSEDLEEGEDENICLAGLSCFDRNGPPGPSLATCLILDLHPGGANNTTSTQYERVSWNGQATVVLRLNFAKTNEWYYDEFHVVDNVNAPWMGPRSTIQMYSEYVSQLHLTPVEDFEMLDRTACGGDAFSNKGDGSTGYHAFSFRLLNTGEVFFAAFQTCYTTSLCYLEGRSNDDNTINTETMLRTYVAEEQKSVF